MRLEHLHGRQIFVIHEFLTPAECEQYIARSEDLGYGEAPISMGLGFVVRKDIRNNARLMVDDHALAETLGARARPFLPATWFDWALVGFNERFRYYRYDAGQKFEPHFDGYFERPNGERSFLTFMVYLNDGFEGGATAFHQNRDALVVRPERGKALVFYHKQLHEGRPVGRGRKYLLRTDVMYRPGSRRPHAD